ncbi:MAG TPA: ATP-binding protein [Solirubrobacterales bacterium]
MPQNGPRKSPPTPRQRLAAAEAERARWAGRLHGETLQGLAELRMSLAAIEGADPFAVGELIQRATADLEREAERVRSLIVELRPVTLDRLGIEAAIESLADCVERPKLEVKTTIELAAAEDSPAARFDDERETAIYRIVEAALDNAVKHAEASRVVVEVVEDEGRAEIAVTVSDDGNGFDPAAEGEGIGLSGMRERVEILGGSIEVRTEVDRGTAVSAVVPSGRGSPVPARAI